MSIGGNNRGHDLWPPEIGQKRPVPENFSESYERERERKRVDHTEKESKEYTWGYRSESPELVVGDDSYDHDDHPKRRFSVSGKPVNKTENKTENPSHARFHSHSRKHSLDGTHPDRIQLIKRSYSHRSRPDYDNHSYSPISPLPRSNSKPFYSNEIQNENAHSSIGSSGFRKSASAFTMSESDRQQAHRPQANSISEDFPILLKAFNKYTDSVVTTSVLAFRRELVKEKVEKSQRQRERWSRQAPSFIALAEDHDRASEKAVAIEGSANRKIKQNRDTKEKALLNLLTSFMDRAGGPLLRPEDINDTKEIDRLKAEVNDTKNAIGDLQHEIKKPNGDASLPPELENRILDLTANTVPKSTIVEYESKVAHLTVNLSKVQTSLNKQEHRLSEFPDIRGVMDKINALELNFGKAEKKDLTLTESMVQQQNKTESLGKDLAIQKGSIEQLSTKVTHLESDLVHYNGESIKRNGDIDKILERLERDLIDSKNKTQGLEESMASLNKWRLNSEPDISQLKTDLRAFVGRLQGLETSMSTLNAQSTLPTQAESDAFNKGVNKRLDQLGIKLNTLWDEQTKKDEMISEECDKLENTLKNQEKSMEKVKEDISLIQSQALSASNTKPPTPPPQVDSFWKSEEFARLKFEYLEQSLKHYKESSTERIDSMEVLVESQQQRFDNLNTEPLAASIIHQMRGLYPPHPGNIQKDLNQIKGKQQMVDASLFNSWRELGKHKDQIDSLSTGMATFQNIVNNLGTRIDDLKKVGENDGIKDAEGRMEEKLNNLARTFQANHQALEQRLSELALASGENVDSVRRKLADTSDVHQSLQTLGRDLRKDMEANDNGLREDIDAQRNALKTLCEDIVTLRAESTSNPNPLIKTSETIDKIVQDLRADMDKAFRELRVGMEANNKSFEGLRTDMDKTFKDLRKDIEAKNKLFEDLRADIDKTFKNFRARFDASYEVSNALRANIDAVGKGLRADIEAGEKTFKDSLADINKTRNRLPANTAKTPNNLLADMGKALNDLRADIEASDKTSKCLCASAEAYEKNFKSIHEDIEHLRLNSTSIRIQDIEANDKTFENVRVDFQHLRDDFVSNDTSRSKEIEALGKSFEGLREDLLTLRADFMSYFTSLIKENKNIKNRLQDIQDRRHGLEDQLIREISDMHPKISTMIQNISTLNQMNGITGVRIASESNSQEFQTGREPDSVVDESETLLPRRPSVRSVRVETPEEGNKGKKRTRSPDDSYNSEDDDDDHPMRSARRSRRPNAGINLRRQGWERGSAGS